MIDSLGKTCLPLCEIAQPDYPTRDAKTGMAGSYSITFLAVVRWDLLCSMADDKIYMVTVCTIGDLSGCHGIPTWLGMQLND